MKNQLYATYPLDAIPRALPEGAWLTSFNLSQKKDGSQELILNGYVYLDNSEKEFDSVNVFLTNLKKDSVFANYFQEMVINSIDRKTVRSKSVAVFTIVCKNFPEKA